MRTDVSRVAEQGAAEYEAGRQYGYAGGEQPARNKGASYYGGWLNGKARREAEQELQQGQSHDEHKRT